MERDEKLKNSGYFTVLELIKKLTELQSKGLGEKLIAGMDGYFQYCDYSELDELVLIC